MNHRPHELASRLSVVAEAMHRENQELAYHRIAAEMAETIREQRAVIALLREHVWANPPPSGIKVYR